MERSLPWFLILGAIMGCNYNYEALKSRANGGTGGISGSGGDPEATGTGGDEGSGGSGAEGAATGGAAGTMGSGHGGSGPKGGALGSGSGGAAAGGRGGTIVVGSGGTGTAGAGGGPAVAGSGGMGGAMADDGGNDGRGQAGGNAGAAGGGGAGEQPDVDLVLWYKFDDAAGMTAVDSSSAAGGPRNATLALAGTGGAIAFTLAHQVGTYAVSLTGNGVTGGGNVLLPSLADLAPQAVTISAWVYVTASQHWQRVFDLGKSTADCFAFTTHNASDNPRFLIRRGNAEQTISGSGVLSLNAWHHVAVVLPAGSPYTGRLYIDGAQAGTNTAMTVRPGDLGPTANNFLGKSQFTADPYFSGAIDDLRVYRRALGASEITALFGVR